MKYLSFVLCLLFACQPAAAVAQLVVFDNSHTDGDTMYDDFIAVLELWGYDVEKRTTPLVDNGDADVIVILTEDGYTSSGAEFTPVEVVWLKEFVDSGKGLLATVCPNNSYWAKILGLMNVFGIAEGNNSINPAYYDQFADHPIFVGVTELGDDYIYGAMHFTLVAPTCCGFMVKSLWPEFPGR